MSGYIPYRDKQDRHEQPVGVRYNDPEERRYSGSLIDNRPLYGAHNVPDSEYESLMVAPPMENSRRTIDDKKWATELIEDLMAVLNPKERSVIELVVFGQMSLSQAGDYLGTEYGRERPYSKALVAKYRDSALEKLRVALQEREDGS